MEPDFLQESDAAAEWQEILQIPRETDPESGLPIVPQEEVTFFDGKITIGGRKSGLINILLVGQDRGRERPHEGKRTYSDVILLCSFQRESQRMTMTSIQRDIFVDIPGYGANKLNHAFRHGGLRLLKRTLKRNFGIHVDTAIEVDLDAFPMIVDALGGVSLDLTREEADEINRLNPDGHVEPGLQTMNGAQTLTYCRFRKLDSDHVRTGRQQNVLESLLNSSRDLSRKEVLKLALRLIPLVESDRNILSLLNQIRILYPMAREFPLYRQQIPAEGTYETCLINDQWAYHISFSRNAEFLYHTLVMGLYPE